MPLTNDPQPGDMLVVRLSFSVFVGDCALDMLFFGTKVIITAVTYGSTAITNVSALALKHDGIVHSVMWEHGEVHVARLLELARA